MQRPGALLMRAMSLWSQAETLSRLYSAAHMHIHRLSDQGMQRVCISVASSMAGAGRGLDANATPWGA